MSSAPILALGVLWLDLLLGPMRRGLKAVPAPPVVLARVAVGLSRRLDRPNRSDRTLRARGVALAVLLYGGAASAGVGLQILAGTLPRPYGAALVGVVLWGCIRAFLPLSRLRRGSRALGADPARASAILQQTAVSFVHFVVAPLFWFLVAGLPGVLVAAAAWALDRAADGSRGRSRPFGAFARGFALLASWLPGLIAGLTLAVAALVVPKGRPILALRQGWGHARLGQGGVVAAMAAGLGVALRGPAEGGGAWLGGGTARIGRADVLRATWLYLVALLIVTGLLILAALIAESA